VVLAVLFVPAFFVVVRKLFGGRGSPPPPPGPTPVKEGA
jgi:hypothetical protein